MTKPLLHVENLRIEIPTRHGVLVAVDDVSFEVAPGEILGVVGESGAGKSLTGRAILGLLDPPLYLAGGKIRLGDKRIDHLSEKDAEKVRGAQIGAIFQDPLTSLNPLFTIGDQLIETIRQHDPMSFDAARMRAIQLLADVGIPAPDIRVDQYPHQFSGGMRQRVVIALAVCAGPRLIIADEPTTALDVSIQAQILTLLKKLCSDNGAAVLLITHDMGVVAETADRVMVMYAGRQVETGTSDQVIAGPEHPYTRGLMGAIPSMHHKRKTLAQIPGAMPHLSQIPPGCAFHPRCPSAFALCFSQRPEPASVSGRSVSCFLHQEAADGRA